MGKISYWRVVELVENIKKMFYEDIREKKRSANGVHSKTGVRGYIGKVRFATDLMSPREKAEYTKSGKVVVFNMNDIITYEKFKEFDKAEQKEYLLRWRTLYKNDEIIEKMNIPKNDFFDLVRYFGLLKPTGPRTKRTELSEERMRYYLNNPIKYKKLRNLDEEQKAILFDAYSKHFDSKAELADMWGISRGAIYSLGDRIRKWKDSHGKQNVLKEYLEQKGFTIGDISKENTKQDIQVKEDPKIVTEDKPGTETDETNVEVTSQHKAEEIKTENKPEPIENISDGMGFTINGIFEAEILKNRLEKIVKMLDGEASKFKIELKIIENEFIQGDTESDINGDTKDTTQEIEEIKEDVTEEVAVIKDMDILQSEPFKNMMISLAQLMKSK